MSKEYAGMLARQQDVWNLGASEWKYEHPLLKIPGNSTVKAVVSGLNCYLSKKPTNTLEIGSGSGGFLAYAPNLSNKNICAMDISGEMLALNSSRDKILADGSSDLPFMEGVFDEVVGLFVSRYLVDQEKSLAQMVRVTKKRGRVLLIDEGLHSAVENPLQVARFDPYVLARSVAAQELIDVEAKIIDPGLYSTRIKDTGLPSGAFEEYDRNLYLFTGVKR